MKVHIGVLLGLMVCWQAGPALAADSAEPLAKGIQDNSFLIEEAYNQDANTVQHIKTLRRQGRDWAYSFTQEWPVHSQTHQLSYSVPYMWLRGDLGSVQGFGDVMLNYRYQALTEASTLPAFAPRVSLILPTRERDRDTGNESFGYQVNLPVSKIVSDRVTLHGNAGLTHFFDVASHHTTSYNLGASVVYALSRETNLLFETVAEWDESIGAAGTPDTELAVTILPGVRHAFNLPGEAQVVVGAGVPITFSGGSVDYGVFLYLSLEHKFGR
jgi:hypothetical protein